MEECLWYRPDNVGMMLLWIKVLFLKEGTITFIIEHCLGCVEMTFLPSCYTNVVLILICYQTSSKTISFMKGKFRQIYNQIQYIFVYSNGTFFYSVLPILNCIIEWLHFNVDFLCTLSKAHLSSRFLNLVWQQISCLYDSSFCAIIDLKALRFL